MGLLYLYLYLYYSNLKAVTLALTHVTGSDIKNEFFMGQNDVCRTAWKEANYSDESKPYSRMLTR